MNRTMLCMLPLLLGPAVSSIAGAAGPTDADLLATKGRGDWLNYGRTYDNQRFSPLTQIKPSNVKNLRPVWAAGLNSLDGLEATPIIHDGVLYVTGSHAHVFAFDAANGRRLWSWAPEEPEGLGTVLCCGPVNRGVAIYGDHVFVETLDAKLVALNKDTGAVAWEKVIADWQTGYSATGAPLVAKGKVIVGVAGGEYGVRGFIKAYDAVTGDEKWTSYTIPGAGEPGNDSWPGDTWKTGGGATWQTGAFDPALNLLYWGTSNPGPWTSDGRKGDNLWTASLLAIDADTGVIKWGYQYTPNDAWDYDGNNAPILADIKLDGKPVKAALQSNRNGFFYVLDRTNGRFLYATPTVDGINWTSGLDPVTGRPKVNEDKRPLSDGKTVMPIVPGLEGGTNWFPMAYNPDTRVAFVPTNTWAMSLKGYLPEDIQYEAGKVYMGVDYKMYRTGETVGRLRAFDVEKKKWLWEIPSPLPLFAGVLATKSGLVFTGDQLGFLYAADAKTGEVLWRFQTGSGLNASPVTYAIGGKQYVAILSGLGGDPSFYYSAPKGNTLWVFALEGLSTGKADAGEWKPDAIPEMLDPLPTR
ncbi:MAG: PQQ-dependent dehydrogenase, methanol/ethanol family [Burkholderiales bacterium]|nr:PQQ-dependent dehydrogenase, methanol/ethanol family [Burkholderiales bacterium]